MRSRVRYARALIFGRGPQGTHMGNICRVWPNLNPDMAKWDTLININKRRSGRGQKIYDDFLFKSKSYPSCGYMNL